MPKPITKRVLPNILLVHIDTVGGDTIKQVLCWILDPNKLTFSSSYFNSNNIIENKFTVKTTMEKVTHFIKWANETGRVDTLPDLLVWSKAQLDLLKQYIPNIEGLVGHITLLQDRCRDIFKTQLVLQGFSLFEIAGIMGIKDDEPDFKKFALIASKTERALKDLARKLKDNGKSTKTTTKAEGTSRNKEAGQ